MKIPQTPQEISDYKTAWMKNPFVVHLHSDLDVKGKDWCRKNLERWEWKMDTYTASYEHTFFFEHKHDSEEFRETFGKFAND